MNFQHSHVPGGSLVIGDFFEMKNPAPDITKSIGEILPYKSVSPGITSCIGQDSLREQKWIHTHTHIHICRIY